MKICCTGDLHLGRHPSQIPEHLDDIRYSPSTVWMATVNKAVEEETDLVVVTGDVIDRKNRYYEAFGDFELGVRKLSEFDIPCYLISGNHDFDVLPELVHNLGDHDLYLLGENGQWESTLFRKDDKPRIQLIGWSYPSRHVHNNPLEDFNLRIRDDLPTLGVLHTEWDKPNSPYASVTSRELESTRVPNWFFGHSHQPEVRDQPQLFALNPGSPQPLAPTEQGVHGPWMVDMDREGIQEVKQFPLSNLRYASLNIDASDFTRVEQIPAAFYEQTRGLVEEAHPSLKLLLARVNLHGRSQIYREVERKSHQMAEDLTQELDQISIAVTSIYNHLRPPVDLEKLSKGRNPPGVLAKFLLKLESRENGLPENLLEEAAKAMRDAYFSNAYRDLRSKEGIDPPGPEDAVQILQKQCRLILDSLISQKDSTNE